MESQESGQVIPSPRTGQHFARNVRRRREARGISQDAVVAAMREAGWDEFNSMALSRVEKGTRRAGVDEALAIAAILETTLEWLIAAPASTDLADEVFETKRRFEAARADAAAALEELDAAHQDCVELTDRKSLDWALGQLQESLSPNLVEELHHALKRIEEYSKTPLSQTLYELEASLSRRQRRR